MKRLIAVCFFLTSPGWAQSGNSTTTTMEYDDPDTSSSNSTMYTGIFLGFAPYSGVEGSSLTGATAQFVTLGREDREGFLRMNFGVGMDMISGTTTFEGDSSASTLSLTLFKSFLGAHIYFFQNAGFLPFIGGAGLASLGTFEVTGSTVAESYSRPQVYGYEVSMGVDFRSSGEDSKARDKPWLRLKLSWAQESGPFAAISGFRMDSFRFSVGL